MIKILNETPVALATIEDLEQPLESDQDINLAWIYENPTLDEIEELDKLGNKYRVLVVGNNYYIASGYYLIHNEMIRVLYDYTHTRDYDASFVIRKKSAINVGQCDAFREITAYEVLRKVFDNMKAVGIIDENTVIDGYFMRSMKLGNFFKRDTSDEYVGVK